MADVRNLAIMTAIINAIWVALALRYCTRAVWPTGVALVIGSQLYPLNEALQHFEAGPILVRNHLSSLGITLEFGAVFGIIAMPALSLFTAFPVWSRIRTQRSGFFRQRRQTLTPLLLWSTVVGLGFMVVAIAGHELFSIVTVHRDPGRYSRYSGGYDWGDVGAGLLGALLVAGIAYWDARRWPNVTLKSIWAMLQTQ